MSDRTTGDLFSAMHSVRARDVQAQRTARREEAEGKRAEIRKSEVAILELIDNSRKDIPLKLWNLIGSNDTKEQMEAKKLAMQLFDNELYKFRNQMSIIVNKPPLKKQEDVWND